jgi:HlyD family secretion protein
MKRTKVYILSGLALIIIIVVVLLFAGNDDNGSIAVRTAKVERQKIIETVTATGIIEPETQVKISADVAAKIIQLGVEEGDWVEKGQFLVQLDRERFEAAAESYEANLGAAKANANVVKENMKKAAKDYERIKELFDKKLESEAIMDQTYAAHQVEKARYQAAGEQVDQALATLRQARDDLSKTTIHSPMAGTVSQLNKEEGEIALGSQFQEDVIMVISNLAGMEALVDVDENDIIAVQLQDSAVIEVDALPDIIFKGIVSEIASSAKITATGTADQKTEFEVKILIDQPGDKLRPGMTASADIITDIEENAVVVPIQCVSSRTPKQLINNKDVETEIDTTSKPNFVPDREGFVQVVFVVNSDNVEARAVNTGIQSETHIEIIEGLSQEEEIVTGNYRAISQLLQNNSRIKVLTEEEEAGS